MRRFEVDYPRDTQRVVRAALSLLVTKQQRCVSTLSAMFNYLLLSTCRLPPRGGNLCSALHSLVEMGCHRAPGVVPDTNAQCRSWLLRSPASRRDLAPQGTPCGARPVSPR